MASSYLDGFFIGSAGVWSLSGNALLANGKFGTLTNFGVDFITNNITRMTLDNLGNFSILNGKIYLGTTLFTTGFGTPETFVTAPVGSLYTDTSNGYIYTKYLGVGNTGWKITGTDAYFGTGTLATLDYATVYSPSTPPLIPGLVIEFTPNVNNPANATINAVLIKKPSNTGLINLEADDLMANGIYTLTYNGTFWIWTSTDTLGYQLVTGTTTLIQMNMLVEVDATSGPIIINLPTSAGRQGEILYIKRIDNTTNTVTLDGNAAETIDGVLTKLIVGQYTSRTLISNGANLDIVGSVNNIVGKSFGLISLSALTPLTITHNLQLTGTFRGFSSNFIDTASGQNVFLNMSGYTSNSVVISSPVTINLDYTLIG